MFFCSMTHNNLFNKLFLILTVNCNLANKVTLLNSRQRFEDRKTYITFMNSEMLWTLDMCQYDLKLYSFVLQLCERDNFFIWIVISHGLFMLMCYVGIFWGHFFNCYLVDWQQRGRQEAWGERDCCFFNFSSVCLMWYLYLISMCKCTAVSVSHRYWWVQFRPCQVFPWMCQHARLLQLCVSPRIWTWCWWQTVLP